MTPTPEEIAVGRRMYELRKNARYSRARLAAAMRNKGNVALTHKMGMAS